VRRRHFSGHFRATGEFKGEIPMDFVALMAVKAAASAPS
jgi:hypothetical protein